MSRASLPAWDETEIAAVPAGDLAAALQLWLARERQGLVLVDATGVETQRSIDAAVLAMSDHPARGLPVLMRMRCLAAALQARRFRHLMKPENAAALAAAIKTAAHLRLNARWGLSPVRLAWAIGGTSRAADQAAAAA